MNNSTTITQADGSIVTITKTETNYGWSPRDFLSEPAGILMMALIAFLVFRFIRRARRKKAN